MPASRSLDIDERFDLDMCEGVGSLCNDLKCIEFGGKTIGPGHPTFIIAEAGVNHDGR